MLIMLCCASLTVSNEDWSPDAARGCWKPDLAFKGKEARPDRWPREMAGKDEGIDTCNQAEVWPHLMVIHNQPARNMQPQVLNVIFVLGALRSCTT